MKPLAALRLPSVFPGATIPPCPSPQQVPNPVWYNFARINSAVRVSPAMAAGLSETLWDVGEIVKLIEAYENQPSVKL